MEFAVFIKTNMHKQT